ncbi:SRPBCC family protein [Nocardiopsis sediminis]|uniref:SRPBCC family protein n=1 Tax=Nocardiopsis sediminis TaxID=1778267 RepID=A0ABV8FNW1_9ACTN
MRHGTLERSGDRWTVRFARRLAHPPEKVWRAVTEPGHLAAWYPTSIEGERAAGAALRFRFPGEDEDAETGEMLVFDPPKAIGFRQGEDVVGIELRPDGDGTELVFTVTFGEIGRVSRDTAGWHVCLEFLAAHLDGTEPPGDTRSLWEPLNAHYTAEFGPESATIGPPGEGSGGDGATG